MTTNSTEEADDVAEWIAKAYPAEFGDGKTQSYDTDKSEGEKKTTRTTSPQRRRRRGQSSKPDSRDCQRPDDLRHGRDVQNVTVVVGLRP